MNFFQITMAIVFWSFFGLMFYAYIIYSILIWLLAKWFGRQIDDPKGPQNLPSISLLIAAYNEEAVIEKRIQNALAMDYPGEKLEIVVASDGSSDATPVIVRNYADRNVKLFDFSNRRGKAAVLNSALREVNGEIVLLSDANTLIDSCAARKLVRWFQDPQVGVVCGRLVLTDSHTGKNSDGLYWKYETFLKRCEGRLGALLGANGAIYAIRKELYSPIANDTIIDDFVIPLSAKLRTDRAIVYDCEAVAREETAPDFRSEFRRRSRIGAGGFQSIGVLWKLLNPRHGWVAFTYFSHKILRWLGPMFMIGLLVSNIFLLDVPLYGWLFLGQIGFYAFSIVGHFIPSHVKPLKLLRLIPLFTGMNVALLVGFWRWLRGSQKAAWNRTARLAEVAEVNETV
jgi:cellulose synthase/poly-beta-1,6-N-acetylglucosamine synthase-like glycosyltransferase